MQEEVVVPHRALGGNHHERVRETRALAEYKHAILCWNHISGWVGGAAHANNQPARSYQHPLAK
jgi:hypothetical protein